MLCLTARFNVVLISSRGNKRRMNISTTSARVVFSWVCAQTRGKHLFMKLETYRIDDLCMCDEYVLIRMECIHNFGSISDRYPADSDYRPQLSIISILAMIIGFVVPYSTTREYIDCLYTVPQIMLQRVVLLSTKSLNGQSIFFAHAWIFFRSRGKTDARAIEKQVSFFFGLSETHRGGGLIS